MGIEIQYDKGALQLITCAKNVQNQLEKSINAHNLYVQIGVSVPLALRKHIAKIQAQLEIKG